MNYNFIQKSDIQSGFVSVPREFDKDCDYLKLSYNGTGVIFKVIRREYASGNQIWIPMKTLNCSQEINWEISTLKDYRVHMLLATPSGIWALVGLALALLGLLIKGSLLIGGAGYVLFTIEKSTEIMLLIIASLLEAFGLIIVFYRALWLNFK